MNNSEKKRNMDEFALDFKELCWRLLEQWKAIVLVALLVMAILLGALYLHSSKEMSSAEKDKKESQQSTAQEILDTLPEGEQNAVVNAYRMYQIREQLSEYIHDAPIMKIDPTCAKRLRTSWAFDKMDDITNTFAMSYAMKLQSEECRKALLQASGSDSSAEDFEDLIYIKYPNAIAQDVVCCDVFLTDDMNGEAMQKELKQQVENLHDTLNVDYIDHSLVNYQSEISIVTDERVRQKQISLVSDYANMNNQLNVLKTTFSSAQKEAFSRLQAKKDDAETTPQIQTMPKIVTLRNIVLGLFMGVFIYIGIFLLYSILANRIISTEMLLDSSLRTVAEWHSEANPKLAHLAQAEAIWRKHHRKHLDKDSEEDNAVIVLESMCGHKDLKELLFILTANCSGAQEAFICDLSNRLLANNINASIIKADQANDRALIDIDGVVLVVINAKTRATDLKTIQVLCSDYDKPILGSIYLG